MPTIRTYPPSGIGFAPYSVSPLRTDHSFGRPNPKKNSVTFMPARLAMK